MEIAQEWNAHDFVSSRAALCIRVTALALKTLNHMH